MSSTTSYCFFIKHFTNEIMIIHILILINLNCFHFNILIIKSITNNIKIITIYIIFIKIFYCYSLFN